MSRRERLFEFGLKLPLAVLLIDIYSPNSLPTCLRSADKVLKIAVSTGHQFLVAPIGLFGLHP
jgi:hypothetical protein